MRQRHCFASLPLLFFLLTASASAHVRLGDLVLWYTFDEIRESLPPQVPDQSDNGLDGTISVPDGESPVTVDSRFGKSLKFNGTSNKVPWIPGSASP